LRSDLWYVIPPKFPCDLHTDFVFVFQIRTKSISEKANKKRQVDDEKMIDTVKFLKECLDNHARLVDIVLGRPEPLVQQGTDLIQAMLSEMFGLPAPIMRDPEETPMREVVQDSMEETEEESANESESESELTQFSEDETTPQDFMDIEAVENAETDSDAYNDDDGSSEQSDDSMATVRKSKRRLRRERCKKARKARKELYTRFGLTVEETGAAEVSQDDTSEEDNRRIKRQKGNHDETRVLKQTTLNFDKVRKNRRLFSRKELQEAGQEHGEGEEPKIASTSSIRKTSKRSFRVPPGYRYQKGKGVSPGGMLPRPRGGRC
jgi:hypothetical protein